MIQNKYEILQEYGDYTVLKRDTKFMPFIVAWNLHDDMTWDQGHYFEDLYFAAKFAREKWIGKEGIENE